MVTIKLKIVDSVTGPLDYRKNIVAFLTTPLNPLQGWGIEEMRAAVPLVKKINDANNTVKLNNKEHENIVMRLNNGKYREPSQEILDMVDYITKGEPGAVNKSKTSKSNASRRKR